MLVQSWKGLEFYLFYWNSLNSVEVLEKFLISLLGLEKSLEFTALSTPAPFYVKLDYFAEENLAHPRCKNPQNSQVT